MSSWVGDYQRIPIYTVVYFLILIFAAAHLTSEAARTKLGSPVHGSNGANATEPIPREPAGALLAELLESQNRPEGFVVKTRGQIPENRVPQFTEILPHRGVVLQAVDGDGESGRRGGDGQSGRHGRPGNDATRAQDATTGADGGNGGNAGSGTNVAKGGKGGTIRIYVDEDKTHLLLAASWDVQGGKGGVSGEHGKLGAGGRGGNGGQDSTWQEQTGYQYRCTEQCVGRMTAPAVDVKTLSKRSDFGIDFEKFSAVPEQTYRSRYQLELVDFDVEGRMPSLIKETELEILPSGYLHPVAGIEGRALVPSILAGRAYKETVNIALKASIPSNLWGKRVSSRRAEVKITIPSETGSLLASTGTWAPEVIQKAGRIGAESSIDLVRSSMISHQAKDHAYANIRIEFYISNPGPNSINRRHPRPDQRLTQTFDLRFQVAATHIHDEDACVLVVTNATTSSDRFEAIGDFDAEEDQGGPENILDDYCGKMIIFLGNKFEHFDIKEQTILNLCDSRTIANKSFACSSCVLFGAAADKDERDTWLRNAVFLVSHKVSDVVNKVTESSTFDNKASFTASICELKSSGTSVSRAYQLESKLRWYYGGAKMSVCPVFPRADGSRVHSGFVAIWHGLPPNRDIFATEYKDVQKQRGQAPKLHPFDSFNIVCALPCLLRIRLLYSLSQDSNDDENDSNKDKVFASILEHGSQEHSTHAKDPCDQSEVRLHFSCLDTILQQVESCEEIPPRALEVLGVALATTNPQKKRHIARDFTIPFGKRRAQLKLYLVKRVETLLRNKNYSTEELKQFRIFVREKHSRFSSRKRNIAKAIEQRNGKFTKLTSHEYQKGRQTTRSLVPRTELCTVAEWDARY
ncbi:uncharacterized protein PAC_05633 [Phialocephala subalpina]|uniref:Uncharacterized protein n=1 Tax=Phialocephala subalpina TaxID=576137 RepID=A0A1L7WSK1_9HELO|nr:uncharacterized protein PAC_05633 [Phialocephala subalpina]